MTASDLNTRTEWLKQYQWVHLTCRCGYHTDRHLCELPGDVEFIENGADISDFQIDEDGEATWLDGESSYRAVPCESQLWIYPLDRESDADDNIWDRICDEGSDRIASEAEFDAFVQSDRDNGNGWGWALVEEIWAINGAIGSGVIDRWATKIVEPVTQHGGGIAAAESWLKENGHLPA